MQLTPFPRPRGTPGAPHRYRPRRSPEPPDPRLERLFLLEAERRCLASSMARLREAAQRVDAELRALRAELDRRPLRALPGGRP